MKNNFLKSIGAACFQLALSVSSLSAIGSPSYYRSRRGSYGNNNSQYLVDTNLRPYSTTSFLKSSATSVISGTGSDLASDLSLDFNFEKGQKVKELLLVDGNVQNKSTFFNHNKPGLEVIEIDKDGGIVALFAILSQYSNLDAVHIVSHANSGAMQIGGQTLNALAFENNISAYSVLNRAIKEGGDLLLYGCELAKGDKGDHFLEVIKGDNHFDIAASNDKTGNEAYAGDWDLEIQKGDIEATPLPESIAMNDFTGVLQTSFSMNTIDIVTFGSYGGSANNAQVNENGAGTAYTLTIDGNIDGTHANGNYIYFGGGGTFYEDQVTLSFTAGETFDPASIHIYVSSAVTVTVTGDVSGSENHAFPANSYHTFDLSTFPTNTSSITISFSVNASGFIDEFVLTSITPANTAPAIGGAVASQAVNDNASLTPFSGITIADADGDNVTATITLDNNAKGVLSGTGLSGTGPYTIASSTPAAMQTTIRALSFNPTDNRSATTETTTFTINIDDTTDDTDDANTTVVSSAVAPTLSSSVPTDGASSVATAGNLTLAFDEDIAFGTGNIQVIDVTDGSNSFTIDAATPGAQASISGSVLTINPSSDLDEKSNYAIQIAATAIDDLGGASYAGITNNTTLDFTTADETNPTLSSSSPVDGGTAIATASNLTLTFDEDIAFGTGNIQVIDVTDGSNSFTIDAATPGAQASISGSVLTINPSSDLDEESNYAIQIAGTAIDDVSGNSYAGITNNTTLNFTTADETNPFITSIARQSPSAVNTNATSVTYRVTFSEDLNADPVTGNFSISGAGAASASVNAVNEITANSVYDVVITGIADDGLLDLGFTALTLTDVSGNGFSETITTEQTYTIDQKIFNISSIARQSPTAVNTNATSVTFRVTFSEDLNTDPVTGNFSIGGAGAASASVNAVNEITANSVYDVVITGITGDGLLDLGFTALALTDVSGNGASGTIVTEQTYTIDNMAPSGYSLTDIDVGTEPNINNANLTAIEFSAAGLETGTTLNYSFTSNNGGTPVTGTETVTTASEVFDNSGAQYDLTGLADGTITLTITLTDAAGNTGSDATDTEAKDALAPSGYTVAWDDNLISSSEASTATFTVSGAEIGATIQHTVTSSGDGNTVSVTASAVVVATSNTQQVTLDVSSLQEGTLRVQVVLTDPGGNNGALVQNNSATLDKTAPVLSSNSPVDEATNIDIESDITLTFDQNVSFGTGSIQLIDLDDASGNITIDAASPGSAASITGAVLTITNPSAFLEEGTDYAVQVANTAILEASGNPYIGITDNTTLNFTTEAAPQISINDPSATTEGNSGSTNATFRISLNKTSPKTVTVDYLTADNTAIIADNDYSQVVATTVTFAAGETFKDVNIAVNGDTRDEDDETFFVNLQTPVNASISDNQGTNTITDDDAAPTVQFSSASSSGAESVSSTDISVVLSAASSRTITVGYTVFGTATGGGTDYTLADGTVTFTADDVSENITIASIVDDAILEANETVIISLSSPANATLGINDSHTYTINNNDAAAVTIADIGGDENSGAITVTAILDNAVQGGFSVDVSTADGTATIADSDYGAVTAQTLAFAGTTNEMQTFTVTPTGDTKLEVNETLVISQSNLTGTGLTVDITDGATVTINNDDAAAVTIADISGAENDGAITITATLDNPVQGGFTVDVSTTDGTATTADSDYTTIVSQTLAFAGTTGELQTFSVSPTSDDKEENDENIMISMGSVGSTSLTIDVSDGAIITITNDDNTPVVTAAQSFTIAENLVNASVVGTIVATDADAGTSFGNWTISSGDIDGVFDIDGASGQLTIANQTSLDHESTTSYTLSVTVSDGTNTSTAENVTVNVSDVNDVVPVITASQSFDVSEGVTNGSSVGTVLATDGDITASTFESWTITSGNTSSDGDADLPFAIDASTGVITINDTDDINSSIPVFSLVITVSDGVNTSLEETITINASAINNAPSFTVGEDQTVLEDAGVQTIEDWATDITTGSADETSQVLTFNVSSTNTNLFEQQPAVSAAGTLSFLPQANAFGSSTVTISLSDDGGTANGGVDQSTDQTFTITIEPINDVPTFTSGPDQTISAGVANYTVENWATAIRAGADNESDQTLTFNVTNDSNEMFTAQPAISSDGDLSYSLADEVSGSALVSVSISDDGGTANGGDDTSDIFTFTIEVGQISQTITFEAIENKKVGSDPIELEATGGNSGLPITFSITTTPDSGVASLVDGTIVIAGVGTVVVTASQAGNDTYEAAEDVSQTFEIESNELFLPTLFTPNGDRTNDAFILRGGGSVADIEFNIYDRESNLVFTSNDFGELSQLGWDGTSNGSKQPQGVYIWVVNGNFSNNEPILINGTNTGIIRLAR